MASSTRSRVRTATRGTLLMTRETVWVETLAYAATSWTVALCTPHPLQDQSPTGMLTLTVPAKNIPFPPDVNIYFRSKALQCARPGQAGLARAPGPGPARPGPRLTFGPPTEQIGQV